MVTVDFDDSFNTKVWSVDHIIIVTYINGVLYGGLQKSGKFTCSGRTFGGCWFCIICILTHLYHLYTLHSSQVMLWGLKRAERLPCFDVWCFETVTWPVASQSNIIRRQISSILPSPAPLLFFSTPHNTLHQTLVPGSRVGLGDCTVT